MCTHARTHTHRNLRYKYSVLVQSCRTQSTMRWGEECRPTVTGPEQLVTLQLPSRHRYRAGSESGLQRPTHSSLLRSHLLRVPQPSPAVPPAGGPMLPSYPSHTAVSQPMPTHLQNSCTLQLLDSLARPPASHFTALGIRECGSLWRLSSGLADCP